MTEQQQLIESPRIACALGSRPHCEISAIMLHCTFTSNFQYNWSATRLSTHQIVFLHIIGIEPQTSLGIL
jgi:hypothetical protein